MESELKIETESIGEIKSEVEASSQFEGAAEKPETEIGQEMQLEPIAGIKSKLEPASQLEVSVKKTEPELQSTVQLELDENEQLESTTEVSSEPKTEVQPETKAARSSTIIKIVQLKVLSPSRQRLR